MGPKHIKVGKSYINRLGFIRSVIEECPGEKRYENQENTDTIRYRVDKSWGPNSDKIGTVNVITRGAFAKWAQSEYVEKKRKQ